MNLKLSDRLLILLEAVITLALVACSLLGVFGWNVMGEFTENILSAAGMLWGTVILCGLGLIVILLGVFVLMVAFRHEPKTRPTSFILIESGEKGAVKISVSAVRQMVEQAICNFDGVSQIRIEVRTTEDNVTVNVDAVIASGVHVPTVTLNMQQAIRQYVEENCGIAVRSVDVTVNSVDALPEGAGRPVISAVERPGIQPPEPVPQPAGDIPAPETPEETAPVSVEAEPDSELSGSEKNGGENP